MILSQWRHRRRRRDDDATYQERRSNDDEQNPSALSLHEGRKKKRQSCCCCNRNRQRSRIGVLIIIIIIATAAFISIHLGRNTLVRKVKDVERYINNSVRDKHKRAMFFLPLRYLRVKWFDPLPTHERKFVMKYNSTFVVNLDSDRERWVAFQRVNQKRIEDIQRISATTLIPHGEFLPLTQKQSKESEEKGAIIEDDAVELKTQQMYFDQYPALQYLAKHDGMGSAACSLSHLRLFQHLLDHDAHYDYMFVFEDDIEILDPLLDSGVVMAPNNADLVLLSEASLGHVNVSWRKKGRGIRAATKDDNQQLSNKNAIRVTSGYSAWGYIITKRGARIILDEYKHERTEPMDVYFFKNPNLKVYLPTSAWPVVAHGKMGIKSTRRDRDTLNNS